MTATQTHSEGNKDINKFDKDFLDFISDYVQIYGLTKVNFNDPHKIDQYIKNVKLIINNFEYKI